MTQTTSPRLMLFAEQLDTALGVLWLLTDDQNQVRAVDWADHQPRLRRLLNLHEGTNDTVLVPPPARSEAARRVEAYFAGQLDALDTIPVACRGTPFQREVWQALRRIPVGTILSYAKLAAAIGRPTAIRAVGLANGANPISVIVPCHRVIGANAALTGYAGGLERKRWLLEHEGALAASLALVAPRHPADPRVIACTTRQL